MDRYSVVIYGSDIDRNFKTGTVTIIFFKPSKGQNCFFKRFWWKLRQL